MKIIDIEQGSPEWVALRNKKIGASDAPIIMEISPWKTPYQLWQEKLGLNTNMDNEAMKRGRDLEPIARQKFIDLIRCEVFPSVAFHDTIEFMMASFDGISKDYQVAVEIKCPGREDHEKAMDGIIPEKYIPQLQHQMEILNLQSMFYFSYSEKSCKILEIDRDNILFEKIYEKERHFWACMQDLETPDLIERDYVKREDQEWLQLASEWIELANLEEKKERIRKRLIEMSGKSNSMGGGIKLSKIPRKGTVDYKSIPELSSLDLEKYRKPTIETFRIGVC